MQRAQKQTCSRYGVVRSGFTLAEMIIVVTITMFLLVATMQGFVNSSTQFSFANTDQEIQNMIQQARSLAISGKAQPDYTDYAHKDSSCAGDSAKIPGDPCLATPAHYGVDFSSSGGTPPTYTVTLFVDNHTPTTCPPGPCGKEGFYDPGTSADDYKVGKDIVLSQLSLPAGTQLILPGGTDTTEATIFFSPIFADVSFSIVPTGGGIPSTTLPDDPFFKFGIFQSPNVAPVARRRCYEIHKLAGLSEPFTPATPVDPTQPHCS